MDFITASIQWLASAMQDTVMGVNGEVYAVELTDPIGFTMYVGLAFILYALRETGYVPLRFLPIIAIVLGLLYSGFVEYKAFNEAAIVAGLRLALLGIGSVATVKYFLNGEDGKPPGDTKSAALRRDV